MTEEKRFSKESFTYVLGEALSKALGFFLLPIYASYLSVEEFAVLSVVTMLWPVIVIFIGQAFASYILRGYFDHSDKKQFFGTVLSFSMLLGLVLAFGIHLAGPFLFEQIFKQLTYRPYLQYAVFFAVFKLFFSHVLAFFRARRAARTSVSLSLTFFALNLVAVLIAVYILDAKLIGILNAQLVAHGLAFIVYLIRISPEVSFRFQASMLLPAILFVLPLVPHAVSGWLMNNISAVVIERNLALTDLSVYRIAAQLAVILTVINGGLNQAWAPFVYSNFDKPNHIELLSISARRVFLLSLLVCASLILFSKELLLLMRKPEYLAAIYVFPILVSSYVLQIVYFVHVSIILHHKQSRLMPIITAVSGLVAILLNLLLVPVIGMYGAALATNLAFAVMAVMARLFSRRYVHLQIFTRKMVYFLLAVVALVAASLVLLIDFSMLSRVALNLMVLVGILTLLIWLKLLKLSNLKELARNILPFTFG